MRSLGKVLEAPLATRDRLRLVQLADSGVELRHLEWTFATPRAVLETVLDDTRREIRMRKLRHIAAMPAPAMPAPANDPANDNARGFHDSPRDATPPPRPGSPIVTALETLGRRAAETEAGLWLDGAPVRPSDLVAAARSLGADIAYPGIAPLARAFDTGPSVGPSGRPERRGD